MKFSVRFDVGWMLFDWAGKKKPAETFLDHCRETFGGDIGDISSSGGFVTASISRDLTPEKLLGTIITIMKDGMGIETPEKVAVINIGTQAEQDTPPAPDKAPDADTAADTDSDVPASEEKPAQGDGPSREEKISSVMRRIEDLPGAQPFKELAAELVGISEISRSTPGIRSIFPRCFIFSVNAGCCCHESLLLLRELLSVTELMKAPERPARRNRPDGDVTEYVLDSAVANALDEMTCKLENTNLDSRVICVNISDWISKTSTAGFKKFLLMLEDNAKDGVVVFRVPVVEPRVLNQLTEDIHDVLFVRPVVFPPLGAKELQDVAKKRMSEQRYDMDEAAWDVFFARLEAERSDGSFYGIRTVNKVTDELIYAKMLHDAGHGGSRTILREEIIKNTDLSRLSAQEGPSGEELLNALSGIDPIKSQILETVAYMKFARSLPRSEQPSLHMRFVGNPGTGKTTVARILGRMLKEEGLLPIGRMIEIKGRDLCGRYVGETSPKTVSICRDAYGSVLFIDEAYSLYRGDDTGRDFGREALDTLIAEMENHRQDMVVIMAGYPEEMATLMQGNTGMASRMPYVIDFPGYTREQLLEIFGRMAAKTLVMAEGAWEAAEEYFTGIPDEVLSDRAFGNARFCRNLYERVCAKVALRYTGGQAEMTRADFEAAVSGLKYNAPNERRPIGFDP